MRVHGFSFQTLDLERAERIYCTLFQWKVQTRSKSHLELQLGRESAPYLVFSPQDGFCPTDPGTLTLLVSQEEREALESQEIWKEYFQKEYTDPKARYSSWLDPWKNRIWLFTEDPRKDRILENL